MRHRITNIHFIGIGGSGMSGIAEVLHNLGYKISGSDASDSSTLARLRELGIKATVGHDAALVTGADAVVVSSAIPEHNVELDTARKAGLPVVPRASMLNELLRLRQGIAVAGSHGKTTITSMVASVLQEGGLDPTYVVGGLVRRFGSSAGLGKGEFIVVETDESDGSFLRLSPVIAIASNIDADHLQTYGQDLRMLKRAFIEFLERLPFYGVAVLCNDDSQLRDVGALISRRVISYGLVNQEVDFHAHDIRVGTDHTTYRLEAPYGSSQIKLAAIGEHNVANSLAALAVAHEVNVDPQAAAEALESFAGVGRRLENHGKIAIGDKEVLLIDDYGHHPTEIDASVDALRSAFPDRRLVLIFQPHRYSRTRDNFDSLADALAKADVLVVSEVYAAGEDEIATATGEALANAIRLRGKQATVFAPTIDEIPERLVPLVADSDLVVTMGAGSIGKLPQMLCKQDDQDQGKGND